jgi:hypothetical protein
MFRDQILNRLSRPGEACERLVVEIAKRDYTRRILNEETNQMETVVISSGYETVKELNTTKAGMEQWMAANPEGPKVVSRPNLEAKYPNLALFTDATPWWVYQSSYSEEPARRRRY